MCGLDWWWMIIERTNFDFLLLVVVVQVRSEMIVCVCVWFDFLCIEPMSHTESISKILLFIEFCLFVFDLKVNHVNQSHSKPKQLPFFQPRVFCFCCLFLECDKHKINSVTHSSIHFFVIWKKYGCNDYVHSYSIKRWKKWWWWVKYKKCDVIYVF